MKGKTRKTDVAEVPAVPADITVMRERVAALQRERNLLDALINSMTDEIWFSDTSGTFRLINASGKKEFNLPTDGSISVTNLAGQLEVFRPDGNARDIADAPNLRALRGEVIRGMEEIIRTPAGGELRHRQVNASPVRDGDGTIVGSVSVVRDITDAKRAELALRASEKRFRLASAAARFMVYDLDIATRRMGACHGLDELLGYETPGGGIALDWWYDQVLPEDREACQVALAQSSCAPRDHQRCYRVRHADGSVLYVEDHGVSVSDADGRVERIIGTIFDVTERVRSEEALRRVEEDLRTSLESIGDGFFAVDADWRFLYINAAAERILGISREETLGRDHWDVFPLTRGTDLEAHYRSAAGGVPQDFENHYEPWDRWFHNRCFPRQGGGMSVYFRDITEDKKREKERAELENQLSQARKMDSVGRLAGGVAHDFNNMLSVILGRAEHALRHPQALETVLADLQEIRKAATRSAALTGQLLAFARKQQASPRVLDLDATVAGMLDMLRRLIGEHITLRWNPGVGTWPVLMDPSQVDQVMANLAVNARDAIGEGGTLTVATENRVVDTAFCLRHAGLTPGDWVVLSVSDTGKGMNLATLEHLFEPFFTTKNQARGTGLGLATIYGIVKQNNGFVDVTSDPGHGTTFTIYLPRHREASLVGEETGHDSAGAPAGKTVLIVEDEELVLDMNASVLEELGYHVVKARSAREALQAVSRDVIHVLMTDVVMPDMNGRELSEKLAQACPSLRVLYTSGYTADVIAHIGDLDDDVSFIPKPFTAEQLSAKLREVLRD